LFRNFCRLTIVAVFISVNFTSAQVKTNFEIITILIDETINNASAGLPHNTNELTLNYYSTDNFGVLRSKVVSSLQDKKIALAGESANEGVLLEFTVIDAGIKYTDSFRDGLFGNYLVERAAEVKGSYQISNNGVISELKEFETTRLDTLDYDSIEIIENRSIPFTQGEPPGEPFFSSLLEPAIALGAAVVTVYLFFTVRSN
jgi:hypothetical protein